ncbi:nuclear transport factor 2 family protein [Rhizobium sp. Root1203]|uniref:nuclear transport factor 2 family protein n=1 Tax=Rhizobium sp. Root1203 TaxID=1736427 RepID=UPI003FD147BD
MTSDVIERRTRACHLPYRPKSVDDGSKEMTMINAATIAARYIEVWNETDTSRRQALLTEHWAADALYVDPLMKGHERAEISRLIGAAQERFPGFRFALEGDADGYGDRVRFSWRFGPDSEPDMIMGTDFALIENGQLKQVTGFLDKVPAA